MSTLWAFDFDGSRCEAFRFERECLLVVPASVRSRRSTKSLSHPPPQRPDRCISLHRRRLAERRLRATPASAGPPAASFRVQLLVPRRSPLDLQPVWPAPVIHTSLRRELRRVLTWRGCRGEGAPGPNRTAPQVGPCGLASGRRRAAPLRVRQVIQADDVCLVFGRTDFSKWLRPGIVR